MSTLPTVNQEGVLVVYIRDVRLTDIARIEAVSAELNGLLNHAPENKMLLNFRNVKFMGSAMIGKLVQLNKACRNSDMKLAFCELNENLLEAFSIMNLAKLIKIYDTETDAMDALKNRR